MDISNQNQKQKKIACLAIALIIFLLLSFFMNVKSSSKVQLLDNNGRSFQKGVVTKVLGSSGGTQQVRIRLTTGKLKGEVITARSTNSYLYGAKCKEGSHVVILLSQAKNTSDASVYSIDRGWKI